MKIIASIITYNPDKEILIKNISSVINQVDELLLIDNNSENFEDFVSYINSKVFIIRNEKNLGIANALNQAFNYANQNSYKWILTLDQDSIVSNNYVFNLSYYIEKFPNCAIFAPVCVERKTNSVLKQIEKTRFVSKCITSGSLNNIDNWEKINGFDSHLFIDGVDDDFCVRTILNGKKILMVSDVILEHQVGDIKIHHILWKKIIVRNHSAFRKYYMTRNMVYLAKKYHKSVLIAYFHCYLLMLKTLIYEKQKISKVFAMIKGIKAGRRGY